MKHISILPLYDATIHSIDSAYQLFNRVNDFMRYQGRPALYEVSIVGDRKETVLSGGVYRVTADKTIDEIQKTDIIILPLLCGGFDKAIEQNQVYTDWIVKQRAVAEIVCLCSGSFYLASTGLLDGKKCAVHWGALRDFQNRFPNVISVGDQIITDEDGIYTCAGNFSYLSLLIYIIEKHAGRETAILAAKMFQIEMDRKTQAPFAILTANKMHGDHNILEVQTWIETNPREPFTIDSICEKFSFGKRTFERRFKKLTGNSLLEYAQRVRVEQVKRELESSRKTINEIVQQAGYNDVDAFRRLFKKYTTLTPFEYRKKYNPGE